MRAPTPSPTARGAPVRGAIQNPPPCNFRSGVLLNHETPWWIEDLNADLKAFRSNTVFLGGERGNDAMTMLHAHPTLDGARQITDGLCTGGLAAATKAVEAGTLPAADFKFFFKGSEWLPGQLAKEVEGSLWDILNYDGSLALRQTGHRSLWRVARARKLRVARKAGAKATPPATTTTLGGAQAPSPPSPTQGRRRRPPDPFPAYTGSDADRPTVPVEVLGFRRFMGNAQWRVRWADGDESWEVWGALADALPQNPDEAASESAARKFADDTWREHGR